MSRRQRHLRAEVKDSKPRSRAKPILAGLGALAFLGAVWFAYDYITVGRFIVSTDDAYVGADMAIIAPKIAGQRRRGVRLSTIRQ